MPKRLVFKETLHSILMGAGAVLHPVWVRPSIDPPPHPQLLSQYDDVVPDGAERVVRLAENQARHQQSMEARGQIFAFLLAIVVLLGGTALSATGSF